MNQNHTLELTIVDGHTAVIVEETVHMTWCVGRVLPAASTMAGPGSLI